MIPSSYSLNYTVVPKDSLSYLATWPAGQSKPLVSTLNAPHATVTANAAIVPAGANGAVSIYTPDTTDVIVDINGYFTAPSNGGLSLYPVTPCRALDTRSDPIYAGNPVSGGGSFFLPYSESSACTYLPETARGYVINVTAIPLGWLGFLSIWSDNQTQPAVSTLNSDGSIVSNLALTTASQGIVDVYTSNPTHVIFDVSGYFAPSL